MIATFVVPNSQALAVLVAVGAVAQRYSGFVEERQ
jgi:hypothetical protein